MKYRTVFGDICLNPVAYCRYHKASISRNQLKRKNCIKKRCGYLSKYKHPFWDNDTMEVNKQK